MLYDNGQLVSIYAQAYQLTGKKLYKDIIDHTLSYTAREMTSKENAFYSSLDADSEGEEGKFYVWSKNEIDSIVGDETNSKIFSAFYDVSKKGNWEHTNILNTVSDIASLASKFKKSEEEVEQILKDARAQLMMARDKRIRPGLDDKILTSWNSLMIAGYVDAYTALGNESYKTSALNAAQFIADNQLQTDGRLNRNFKDGKSSINAFLDDYGLTIHAFLKVYQMTLDKTWIDKAELMTNYCITHFYNGETKMFNYTSDLDPPLIAKKSEYSDNVIPASNSSMARSLFTLGTLTYNKPFLSTAEQMMKNMAGTALANKYLSFYSNWMQLLLDHIKAPYEVAIVGADAENIRKELSKNYLGNSIILGSEGEENLDLLKDKLQEDRTMVYVCQNKVCKLPVDNVMEALPLIKH